MMLKTAKHHHGGITSAHTMTTGTMTAGTMTAGTILLTLCLVTVSLAGELNPPPGPITPTMKTLTEVEPRTAVQTVPPSGDAAHNIAIPGSYYLTGNITGQAGMNAIRIRTNDVTIDLNGFSLQGAEGSLNGIVVDQISPGQLYANIAIHNGVVSGFGQTGIFIDAKNCRLSNLRIDQNGENGLFANSASSIEACSANENTLHGIEAGVGCTIRNCSATNNGGDGIRVANDCHVVGNTSDNNGLDGIGAGDGAGVHASGDGSRIDSNATTRNDRGLDIDGVNNVIIRNTAIGNDNNFDIENGNDAGPLGKATAATSPWANLTDEVLCVADAGPSTGGCINDPPVSISGAPTASGGTPPYTYLWSGTGAQFLNDPEIENPTFDLVASGPGTFTLSVTISDSAGCSDSDGTLVQVVSGPTVQAGDDQTICQGDQVALNGGATNTSGVTWSSSGTGSFIPNANTLSAVYTPSAFDAALGQVTLTLTASAQPPCASDAADFMIVSITPSPLVDAGPDAFLCGDGIVDLSATGGNFSSVLWETDGDGTFIPDNATLGASYDLGPNDIIAGGATLTVTASPVSPCVDSTQDSVTITAAPDTQILVHPADRTVSQGSLAIFSVTAAGADLTYQWNFNDGEGGGFQPLPGATQSGFAVSNAQCSDEGFYQCVVTGGCGSVTSTNATLTVVGCP